MSYDEFSNELALMDPVELALGAGMAGAVAVIMGLFSLAWFFLSAIGYYKMYIKAGEAGWKAFIPYYRSYVRFKFAWDTKYFWPFLASLLLIEFLPDSSESLLIGLIAIVCCIVFLVVGIKLDIRVAKSFGKSTGWGVLLFFFPFIISVILGFGKAAYIGNTTIAASTTVVKEIE